MQTWTRILTLTPKCAYISGCEQEEGVNRLTVVTIIYVHAMPCGSNNRRLTGNVIINLSERVVCDLLSFCFVMYNSLRRNWLSASVITSASVDAHCKQVGALAQHADVCGGHTVCQAQHLQARAGLRHCRHNCIINTGDIV